MYNFIEVQFPEADVSPFAVYTAYIYKERYKHELACLTFKDWGVLYDSIKPGSPIKITLSGSEGNKNFFGYVHHVTPTRTPGKDYVEVTAISASYVMKKASQNIFTDMTADTIVKKIAKSHGFVSYTIPHPRVYEQVTQAGHTDWELMVRLAKQCGYSLRTENTELYFQPLLEDYTKYRSEAPVYTMADTDSVTPSQMFSFTPIIGESTPWSDGQKAAVAISGVDRFNNAPVKLTKQKAKKKTKIKSKQEFFDRFDTSVVATDSSIAKHEAEAAEELNSAFAYRATVEVMGNTQLRPDMPIFIDGVGKIYSGFWTILKVEHRIIETQLNVHSFTTVLTVGTDSLGEAVVWSDNKDIRFPNNSGKRTIISNVRQTKVLPTTDLLSSSISVSPQITGPFGSVTNRPTSSPVNIDITAPTWKSSTTSLEPLIPEVRKPAFVIARFQRNGQL